MRASLRGDDQQILFMLSERYESQLLRSAAEIWALR
jgi:hypothetical protein